MSAEAFGDDADIHLSAEERGAVAHAVPRRRRELPTVSRCARAALGRPGIPPVPLPSGRHRPPQWPTGVVGGIPHCSGYPAIAMVRAGRLHTVAIGAEQSGPLFVNLLDPVALSAERGLVGRLVAQTDIDSGGFFSARFPVPPPQAAGNPLSRLTWNRMHRDGFAPTAIALPPHVNESPVRATRTRALSRAFLGTENR
ncbi:hypothetical protein [Streptomyces sp. ID05-47C]|uniref:hypothetical protein n=1 Tax=Streptomyces sp. ID05-47C TaxID=3028665 RepID=UPI0039F539B6